MAPAIVESEKETSLPPAVSFFKTLVRVARVTPGYPTPDSFKLAREQALAILPWLPEAEPGANLGPNLYGTRVAKLLRYATGAGLSPRKRAEIGLARVMLADGRVVGAEELALRLRGAMDAERLAAQAYETASAQQEAGLPEAQGVKPGELRVVFA